ncbi:suppressor of loss of ypt1 [Lobaria immixta]|nr:suppressor of loss of ypt1 [Lobaria immixta]
MTSTSSERRWSSSSSRTETFKFPDFEQPLPPRDSLTIPKEEDSAKTSARTPSPNHVSKPNGILHGGRWQQRRDSHLAWGNTNGHAVGPGSRHGRQKSLSDAIRNIRTRKGSVSANAQELAEALKAPVSIKLVVLCIIWYMSSALTNTSSKSILTALPNPITLTFIQFAFVSLWCVFFAYLAHLFPSLRTAIPALKNGIRYPSRDVVATTLPLALFQLGGHILSSTAIEKIPVSLVHTIKGLSPLFTVLAYRFIFHIHYAKATYLSLIPLTVGVVLACSVEFSGNLFGILCAFGGALIFVTQNIFSKTLFNEAARAEADGPAASAHSRKLDKLNLLCYCSGLAFLLTAPIWLWTDGFPMLSSLLQGNSDAPLFRPPQKHTTVYLPLEFLFNGIFHFAQNILAFILLSLVSPVTYSVASLIKRVFVIVVAIVWFGSQTTGVQAFGIALTFIGLYLYDRTSDSSKDYRRAKLEGLRVDPPLLPLSNQAHSILGNAAITQTPVSMASGNLFGPGKGFVSGEEKRTDTPTARRPSIGLVPTANPWLPPGTRQEETWRPRDIAAAGI